MSSNQSSNTKTNDDAWTIQLVNNNLEKQVLNDNMVPYDKKDVFYQY